MTTNIVTKSLGMMEDLEVGINKVTQVRNQIAVTGNRVYIPVAVDSELAIANIDVNKYTYAAIKSVGNLIYYKYNATDVTGILSATGPGSWLKENIANPNSYIMEQFASTDGAKLVKTESNKTVQEGLDELDIRIDDLKPVLKSLSANNSHKYKILYTLPIRFSAYTSIVAANSYSYMYPSGHCIDHEANELWVFYAASGGDEAAWFVVYDLTTLQEKTYFKAGKRWTKSFPLIRDGINRYLYVRSSTTAYLAKFDVTSLPIAGAVLSEVAVPRANVKYAFASEFGDEILVPYDAPTTNTVSYTNTFNILDKLTWAFRRSIRLDTVGAGNEYGVNAYQYKNQGTVMCAEGIAQAFGGLVNSTDSTKATDDLRLVQGIVVKTAEGVVIKSGLFDPYKGMDILRNKGYTVARFEHEGLFWDKTTNKLTTIWQYSSEGSGNYLIVEAFSSDKDAIDMSSAALVHAPKLTDSLSLYRNFFGSNVPNDPVTGEALADTNDLCLMMNKYDLRELVWYSANFSALTVNSNAQVGSARYKLTRGTNTTFFMDVVSSGLNQIYAIQIATGNVFTYTVIHTLP